MSRGAAAGRAGLIALALHAALATAMYTADDGVLQPNDEQFKTQVLKRCACAPVRVRARRRHVVAPRGSAGPCARRVCTIYAGCVSVVLSWW